MKILHQRLHRDDGTPYPFRESPNKGGGVAHEYLVMHYTAGRTADSAIRTLTDPARKASSHVVIGRDGTITQLVPFDTIAWHAGASSWEGREGLNRFSLGIELDNAGALTRHGARWRAWFGAEYANRDVLEAVHKHETVPRGWHVYTPKQIDAALDVATLLVTHYGLRDVVGHDDIAPRRKTDPGPAFPMQSFRARVFGRADDAPVTYETTTNLNIRAGPGTEHPPIPGSPLPRGTRVVILGEHISWRQVDVLEPVGDVTDIQGWVHGRYLQRAA